jgi:hypothetical protein
MDGMVTAAHWPGMQKKKPVLQARAKNFQGVVLQRRTGFMVFPNAYLRFARAQPAARFRDA